MQQELQGAYDMKQQVDKLQEEGVLYVDDHNRLVASQPASDFQSHVEK